ncbi:SIR2 family protein [Acinetobacter bereziniae]|uniref:SIR2 family protein n=1 Tax=Acinetobacter bereziniae TaxID=106648 RepID=UPI003AF5AC36
MSKELLGLSETIQKFKASLKEVLNKDNIEFHQALNGEEPISFYGLTTMQDEANEYLVDPSDILFWHDPEAYIDELDRWESQDVLDRHLATREYLEQTDQINLFNRFVDVLKKKRVAPFVGAGVSRPYKYPLWGEAINDIIKRLEGISASEEKSGKPANKSLKEIKELFSKKDYIATVQKLYEHNKVIVDNTINSKFDGAEHRVLKGVIELIPQLTDGCVITTNFDKLLETVFEARHKPFQGFMHGIQQHSSFASKLVQGSRCILKLHGTFDANETYIFSKQQYDDAYGNSCLDYTKPLAKVLRQIFISHSLVFIGCSLEQDRTLELFLNVVDSNVFDIPNHFAFLSEADHSAKVEKETLISRAKIIPIWYQVIQNADGSQNHGQLEQLLSFAIDCANGRAKL